MKKNELQKIIREEIQKIIVETVDSKFVKRANEFVSLLQKKKAEHMKKHFPRLKPPTFTIDKGHKYWRIVQNEVEGSGKFVFCFLDTRNGDILKPAGWKAPAKHPRGNIFDADVGLNAVNPYGTNYLDRSGAPSQFKKGHKQWEFQTNLSEASRPCSCGSGLDSDWTYDARGIPLKRVCAKCEKQKMGKYRPDVLNNPTYYADEPIDPED